MKILLLEDDKVLSETIQDALIDEGFVCDIALTGNTALELSYDKSYDLYLLDIHVPGILGDDLLNELREAGDTTPAIFVTSMSSNESVLNGFKNGCDDYIKKPFSLAELRARIHAIFYRVYGVKDNIVSIDKKISFNLSTFELSFDGGKKVSLKKTEGELLYFFIKNRGDIVSKDQIIEHIWKDKLPSDVVLRVHISAVKKLIGKHMISTFKGWGYRLEKIWKNSTSQIYEYIHGIIVYIVFNAFYYVLLWSKE